jgi:putative heme-binding domain-containing protein
MRGEIVDVLLRRPEWTRALLDAVQAQQVAPRDLDALAVQRLTQHRERDVRDRAAALLSASIDSDRERIVQQFLKEMPAEGDAQAGRALYEKRCGVCHRLGEIGVAVGPNLSALTDKSREAMVTAVLDPNRAVEARYASFTALTSQGLTFTGLLEEESAGSITLLGQEGQRHTLARADLDVFESAGRSLMPDGLEKDLSPVDLANILAFVQSAGSAPKSIQGNQPVLVTAERLRGEFSLLASNCEIHGGSLTLEPVNNNLGYWAGEDDCAIWTVEITRPGRYHVLFDWACDDATAGNQWLLEIGDQRLTGTVSGTGDWSTYRREKVGEITLQPGRYRVGLRSYGRLEGFLFDLRSVTLRP